MQKEREPCNQLSCLLEYSVVVQSSLWLLFCDASIHIKPTIMIIIPTVIFNPPFNRREVIFGKLPGLEIYKC